MVELATLQAVSYIMGSMGVFLAAVYYIFNMRATQQNMKANLDARQAQLYMNIYDKFTSRQYWEAMDKHFLGKQPTQNYEEYKKLTEDSSFKEAFWYIGTLNEGMGVLVKEGYINVRLVAQLMSGGVRGFWERMKPAVVDGRKVTGYSRWLSETEYLYNELIKYLKEHPEMGDSEVKIWH